MLNLINRNGDLMSRLTNPFETLNQQLIKCVETCLHSADFQFIIQQLVTDSISLDPQM